MKTYGIAQNILTRITSNLSGNTQPNPNGIETLSPASSSTTTEADNTVVSPSENVLCVGTRVLAAWDRFRYHNGVAYRIDDKEIHVAFDMGELRKFALNCKDKIVIDRKAAANELAVDTQVLARLTRGKAMYKGRIHSSGTTRGYCIVFDDSRRDRMWKRAKSLRVIKEFVVEQGGPTLDHESRIDMPCTNEELDATNESSNTLNLPSQMTLPDDVLDNLMLTLREPKIFQSRFPSMAYYGQTPVLRFPETVTRKITSEIQSPDEFPVQQFSNLSPASDGFQSHPTPSQCRVQSNLADTRSNITGFHSNVSCSDSPELQRCSDDYSFQPTVALSRDNLNGFQSDDVDSRSSLTRYQCTTDSRIDEADECNFQSNFVQDIFNYFPRRRNAPSNTERRDMECGEIIIHDPAMNAFNTQQRPQTFMPLYIGGQTPDGNAVYYALPSHSATPSPFTIGTTGYHVLVPIERLGCENEETRSVHGLSSSAMMLKQERENVSLEESSDIWSTEERQQPCSFQYYDSQGTSTLDTYLQSSEFDHATTYTVNESQVGLAIKKEEKSSCRFSVSQKNTLTSSSYDRQCYRQLDHQSSGFPSCAQNTFSTADGVDPVFVIPPACPISPTTTLHPLPPTHPTPLANLTTPAYTPTAMPLITNVKGSVKLEHLSQREDISGNPITAVYCTPPTGQNYKFHGEPSECSDLVDKPLTREERKRKILSAFGFTNFEKSSSSPSKFRKVSKEETVLPNKVEQVQGVQNCSYDDATSSTIGGNSSCAKAGGSKVEKVGALSPSVVKAATILTNSKLQRWKSIRSMKPFLERSLSETPNETSTTQHSKSSRTCSNTDRRPCEDADRSKLSKSGEESGVRNIVNSNGSSHQASTDEEKKEFTVVNKTRTKRTVAIQVQSKDVKPLRRMRNHQHSTGSQTDKHTTSSETILLGRSFPTSENIEENKTTLSMVSSPSGCSHRFQKSAKTNAANASATEQDTAVLAGFVQGQQAGEEKRGNDDKIKTFSPSFTTPPIQKNLLTNAETDDICLRCDEVVIEDDVELKKEKSRKEMTVQANQQIGLKFVHDAKIFLKFQAEPLRHKTMTV